MLAENERYLDQQNNIKFRIKIGKYAREMLAPLKIFYSEHAM